jgi:2-C-methyl-D-erythritol 4-phosphate cytidylyltransferase/2-C-methyl-D-erythritol 2,4-cyclodiphosphate synthase
MTSYKTGLGTDGHVFSNSGSLYLGCIKWAKYPKLKGDSDGDCIAHAIVDALLSAAGVGDIGSVFGVNNKELQNKSGEFFLSKTLELLKNNKLISVSVSVICKKPKISERKQEMEQKLKQILLCPVSISATTTDGLINNENNGVLAIAFALIS